VLKPFAKNSSIYVMGDIINKAAGFLLIPLYTSYLTPTEYGTIGFLTSLNGVLVTLLSLGMRSVVWRFHYQFDDENERKRFYGSIWLGLGLFSGVCIASLMLFGAPIYKRFITSVPFNPFIVTTMVTIWLTLTFQTIPISLLRIQEKSVTYMIISSTQLFLNIGINILFVIVLKKGLLGVIWGNLLTVAIMTIWYVLIMVRNVNIRVHTKYFFMACKYGLPLVPHNTAQWILGLSDRLVIERLIGLAPLGIYTLGYQFGTVFQTISTSVNVALVPQYSRAAKDRTSLDSLVRLTTYYVLVIAVIGLGLCLWAPAIIKVIASSSYKGSAAIVPWAVLGYFFMGLYYIPMNYVSLTLGRTKNIAWITVLAGVVNIVGNVLFIPKYGVIVAAIMTFVSYFVLFVGLSLFSLQDKNQFYKRYEYTRIIKIILGCVVTYFVSKPFMIFHPAVNILIGFAGLGLFALLLFLGKFWLPSEISTMKKLPAFVKQKVFKIP
jgi:O-antigen/teichoic acid export membrane protein